MDENNERDAFHDSPDHDARKKSGAFNILRWLVWIIVAGVLVIGVMSLLPEASKAAAPNKENDTHAAEFVYRDMDFSFPPPPSFQNATGLSEAMILLEEITSIGGNVSRALFVPQKEMDLIGLLTMKQISSLAIVQTNVAFDQMSLTKKAFAGLATMLKSQQQLLLEMGGEMAGAAAEDGIVDAMKRRGVEFEEGDRPIKMELGEMKSLGSFMDRDDVVAFTTLMRVKAEMNMVEDDNHVVIANAFLPVRGAVFNVMIQRNYEGETDVAFVQDKLRQWVGSIRTRYPVENAFALERK